MTSAMHGSFPREFSHTWEFLDNISRGRNRFNSDAALHSPGGLVRLRQPNTPPRLRPNFTAEARCLF
ncbi:MAG: hypothetical protein U0X92_14035 [Anaerolineales bacterium]